MKGLQCETGVKIASVLALLNSLARANSPSLTPVYCLLAEDTLAACLQV